ncbi:MAG: outer membrane insertion C- signal [Bacteroidetes bacterium]|nr:outer membrane insertion C- signal [Bacteroidota bacterium]MDA1269374.1 outer membrane insertion C- signal [Bacteroidota bacterium]
MRKGTRVILIFAALFFGAITAQAQEIGLRFGHINGNNVALDGIFSTGEFSRVHGNLSFGQNGLGLDALWNPIYDDIPDTKLKWYAGFGPSVYLSENFRLGGAGEVGVEYNFKEVPISLGLDFRPYLFLVEVTEFRAGFGFNARWRLN